MFRPDHAAPLSRDQRLTGFGLPADPGPSKWRQHEREILAVMPSVQDIAAQLCNQD
jgi:hypothetical protein